MKSILLYVNDDQGMESRLQAALSLVRSFDGHLECVTARPLATMMMGDPFGTNFFASAILEAAEDAAVHAQDMITKRLAHENVRWSLTEGIWDAAETVSRRAELADVIVLSLAAAGEDAASGQTGLIGDIVLQSHTPVLAIPPASGALRLGGNVIIAWNGSPEAALAMRSSIPLLMRAAKVHILAIDEPEDRLGDALGALQAAEYLQRHNIDSEITRDNSGERAIGECITHHIRHSQADWLVMGGYGHSRLREWLFGGATHEILQEVNIPVFIAH